VSQICTNSERWLLGVAVDPNHTVNRHVYLFYTRRRPGGDCSMGRATPVGPDCAEGLMRRAVPIRGWLGEVRRGA
jgi:hypothetical protein